jgi:nucleotide-binding universal stress UspA family protein
MYRRILLPVKRGSQMGDQLAYVRAIATGGTSEVRVLHVNPVESFGHVVFAIESPDDASYHVDSAVFELRLAGIGAHGRLRRAFVDRVGREITIDAAEWVPDAIVLGYPGQRSLTRWVRGGIAGRLRRMALCPVLVAPIATRTPDTLPARADGELDRLPEWDRNYLR